MKHIFNIIFLLIALAISNVAFSAHVSESKAKDVAFNFIKRVDTCITSSSMLSLENPGEQAFYIFSHARGFVIVAADDRVTPIIGYSTEHSFPQNNDTLRGNNFWGWMVSWRNQIQYVVDNNISATDEIASQWNNLITHQSMRSMTTVVPPLLTTTWDQVWPYNAFCPSGTVTGCVATAMGQIMAKHDYPAQGLGFYGYQWGTFPYTGANFGLTNYNFGIMPNTISTMTTPADTAVARLLYQTAVSCRSMWGASTGVGYSTGEDPMTRAFINYFKYAYSTIRYIQKSSYTSTQWDSILQVELLAGRPVYYRGDGSLSHAWVLDGVDASTMYHMNWGWGGNYNGYFALSILNPGSNNVTNNQHAIIGIKPNDGSTLVTNTTWSGNVTKTTNVAVPDAITLTASPGAVIKFAKNCRLQIFGRLLSIGTASNYVKFSAIDTTDGWDGIDIDNYYNGMEVMTDNDSTKLIYTQVEYSKSSGLYCQGYGKVLIDHSKINNNHAGSYGAGLSIWLHPINISNSEIYSNHAGVGGGIFIANTNTMSATLSQDNIHDNVSDATGGGFVLSATVAIVLSNSIVYHNYSPVGAGGALLSGSSTIINTKFCNNSTISSSGKGGGLYFDASSAKVVNSLFANNTAMIAGGSLVILNSSNPLLINNTICKNLSQTNSSIGITTNSMPIFRNTIMYDNFNGNGKEFYLGDNGCDPIIDHCNLQGGINALGGPGSGTNYTTGNYTNNKDSIPLFVSPSTGAGSGYNGLTADFSLQYLPIHSPCINAGDTTGVSNLLPNLDLGNNPRINGIIDMGAYEYACVSVPVSVAISVSQNSVCSGTSVTFTAVPTNGGTSPAYQWKKTGATIAGATNVTYSYIPTNGDIITCVLTSSLSCTTGNPATSPPITMIVTTPFPVSLAISVSQNSVCPGTSVTFTAVPTNGGTSPA
ncbi:MAG: C10 family peptidase, partial [bacterium]